MREAAIGAWSFSVRTEGEDTLYISMDIFDSALSTAESLFDLVKEDQDSLPRRKEAIMHTKRKKLEIYD